jgi:hypothetical protein
MINKRLARHYIRDSLFSHPANLQNQSTNFSKAESKLMPLVLQLSFQISYSIYCEQIVLQESAFEMQHARP